MKRKVTTSRQLVVNKATDPNRIMVQCRTAINKSAITHQVIDGMEQIKVSSATLPDDVVMNGILYPANEIATSFHTLDGTHAPIEHPVDKQGNFMSAGDPRSIPDFYAGVLNTNVRQENGRIHVDKIINVSEALKSERGKRLLDRIAEIETNDKAKPIHTSVGVFLTLNELDKPMKNDAGHEYFAIAEDMAFDHDAILLDSVGAAQPEDGVGIAVNKDGQKHKVQRFNLSDDESTSDRTESVREALEDGPFEFHWIEEIFEDRVIFWSNHEDLFEVPYVIDDSGLVTIVGVPQPVERTVTFTPKTNTEGEAMKDLILNALKKADIETEGMSDDELFAAYNTLQASQSEDNSDGNNPGGDNTDIASVVANAVKEAQAPLVERLTSLETNLSAQDTEELDRLADVIVNSDKYPDMDADTIKKLGIDEVKKMAANCYGAVGLSPVYNSQEGAKAINSAPVEMVA